MKPTEILENEHRVIEQVLACLIRINDEAQEKGKLNAESARQAIEFFQTFADQCHHGKEEVHLFPMMESKGYPRYGGPTGVMFHEHEQGRSFIRAMSEAIDAAAQGDAVALAKFGTNATSYVNMLSEHIRKEDHCLFTMANNAMSDEDQQKLMELFDHVEHEEMGHGTHEKYLGIANHLADKYGVPKAEVAGSCGSCGCHH
ncbi:MAG: hemerythrin domain-containing protein [bacterium]|jgi:hemerythrin-like domain-containing protein